MRAFSSNLGRAGFNVLIALSVLAIETRGQAWSSEWPQFLGPTRDGRSADANLIEGWLRGPLRVVWRSPIGVGYSGLAVVGESLYGLDSEEGDEFVFARRTDDGRERWRVRTATSPRDVYGGLGPRVTPSVAGGRVFLVSAEGDALCLDARDGRVVWRRSLRAELGWRPPAEGTAASPLVADRRVYLMNGGTNGRAFLALDASTGAPVWAAQDDRPSYASAVRMGAAQVLFLGGSALFSLEAGTGRLLWRYPWATPDWVNAATPLVIAPDRVFLSSGNDQGAALLRVREGAGGPLAEVLWRNREMKNHFNNSVEHEGVLYGFDNAILKALDVERGTTLWRERGFGKGSLLCVGEHLVVLGEEGELALVEPGREGLRVKARQPVLEGRSWTPPSIAGGRVYLRGLSEVVALGPPPAPR
jgi:outer membrane protein assembly factor BamB